MFESVQCRCYRELFLRYVTYVYQINWSECKDYHSTNISYTQNPNLVKKYNKQVLLFCSKYSSKQVIIQLSYRHISQFMTWLDHYTLRWRHNGPDSVSNHQPHGLFRRRSKKSSKLRVTGICAGKSPGPMNSPHKGPVTRKMFPFDDVTMHSILKPTYFARFQLQVHKSLEKGCWK